MTLSVQELGEPNAGPDSHEGSSDDLISLACSTILVWSDLVSVHILSLAIWFYGASMS